MLAWALGVVDLDNADVTIWHGRVGGRAIGLHPNGRPERMFGVTVRSLDSQVPASGRVAGGGLPSQRVSTIRSTLTTEFRWTKNNARSLRACGELTTTPSTSRGPSNLYCTFRIVAGRRGLGRAGRVLHVIVAAETVRRAQQTLNRIAGFTWRRAEWRQVR